jgi:hypothetical protein
VPGRGQETGKKYERALAIGEAALGPDHPDVGIWRSNLSGVLGAVQEEAVREDQDRTSRNIRKHWPI